MPVRETLEFDLRNALRQVDQLEGMIEDLGRTVTLDVDIRGDAGREIQSIDDRMEDIIVSAKALSRELGETETAAAGTVDDFGQMAFDLGTAENRASDLARELLEGDRAAARLDTEAGQVAGALDRSERQAAGLTSELKQADRAAASISSTASGLESKMRGAFAAVSIGASVVLGLRGANAAVQSFAVLEDSINAVNVIFGEAGDSVLKFGEDAAQAAGLSETAFNQAVVPIGALLQNFGFDAREAGDAAVILVQRAADLASVVGGDVPTALAALSSALRGEADPLEAYGASISAARVEQFILAEGLAKTKAEITPAITLQGRYGLILADTAKVAGDYAATAGDLANAQRTAAAEAVNFGTDIGEVLAPAMEVIVGLVPELLEGLRQLVPGFAAAGDSAAAFLSDAAIGGDESGWFREFLSTLRAGAGDIGELGGGLGDLATLIGTSVVGNVDAADRALARLDNRLARSQLRTIGTQLAKSLDDGTESTEAFTTALGTLGAESDVIDVFIQGYRDFAIQADLTDVELQNATRNLLLNADALGLEADEVGFLRKALNELDETLDDNGRANADYLASIAAIEGSGVFESITTRFTTFTSELEEIPAQMDSIAVRTRAAADLIGQSLNPFDEAPEDIALSAKEFFARVTAEINREAEFQAGIVELNLRGHFDLARMLGPQGPAAQQALTGFLKNDVIADATNAALQTGTTEESEAWGDWIEEQIANAPPGPARDALVSLIEDGIIDSPEVEEGIVRGTGRAANTTVSHYAEQLEEEISTFDASVLQDRVGHLFDDVTFVITEDQFQLPTSLQGVIGVGGFLAGGGLTQQAVTIYQNFTGPIQDLPTQLAQANQSTAAVANLFNRVQS